LRGVPRSPCRPHLPPHRFCGKIDHIDAEGDTAKVYFVKPSAAKTALMLNGGTLEGATLAVTSDEVDAPAAASPTGEAHLHHDGDEIEQEDKPRSAIAAEYLAHGYFLSDAAIQRAIEADHKYGISSKFLSYFNPLADKVATAAQPHVERAATKAKAVDEKRGLSLKAQAGWTVGSKYYQSALASPFGAKVKAFYSSTAKEAQHIHEEALRIKEAKKAKAQGEEPTGTAAEPVASTPAGAAGSALDPVEGVVGADVAGTVPAAATVTKA